MFQRSTFLLSGVAGLMWAAPAAAQQASETYLFDLPADQLDNALLAVSRVTGRQIIIASDAVAGLSSRPLAGRYSADEAIRALLADMSLDVEFTPRLVFVRKRRVVENLSGQVASDDIVVTGSRIRGARNAGTVISTTRADIIAAGQADLGEVARSIPQNFNGGQNPGIGSGAENFGSENVNSGTTLDLRGLGADATLTLLNGRRLAYGSVNEGVDISAIPVTAVERIEIVPDGASALYGSDAVAGVANIILRRDLNGVDARARLTAATSGGYVQKQAEASAGRVWSTGGLIVSGSYNRNSAITADQRSFGAPLDRSITLYPRARHVAAVVSGHQELGSIIEVALDATYSHRRSYFTGANTNASFRQSGLSRRPVIESLFVSPIVRADIGRWRITGNATYGRDTTGINASQFFENIEVDRFTGSYQNRSQSLELSGEGPLLALPGGEARLAAGAAYRSISLDAVQRSTAEEVFAVDEGRNNYSLYGELSLPLIGDANARRGVARLELNAAGRFEHYPGLSDVFTPKLAAVFSPVAGFDIRGTWGRSFKAPTLFQQFQAQGALLLPANFFGDPTLPESATAIFRFGGNRDLEPQRATNWSAGVAVRPRVASALSFEVTYFDTRYRDRIVSPITSATTALFDPSVADLIVRAPTPAAVAAVIDGTDGGFSNLTGNEFDPALVAAIIDSRNLNVAVQRVRGVDVSGSWTATLAADAKLTLTANGSWLDSKRRVSTGQPLGVLAGTIFNPPEFRGRASATLTAGDINAAAFVNVTGELEDTRFGASDRVDGQTTIDLTLAYRPRNGRLKGVEVQLIALNILNSVPDRIRTAAEGQTPYDSTNFSPIGRVLGASLGVVW